MVQIKKKYYLYFLIIWLSMPLQAQTFKAGIVAGANASQVNGDFLAGYDKLGIHLGLKVISPVSQKVDWSLELLWSQRGSRADLFIQDPRKIHLDYVEIPLIFSYKDWLKNDMYKLRFEGGLSAGRLINNKVSIAGFENAVDQFNKTDFSFLVGSTFYSNPHLGFSLRFTNSINLLLNNKDTPGFSKLRGYFLTFRVVYILNP
jgi:hypothetical protein